MDSRKLVDKFKGKVKAAEAAEGVYVAPDAPILLVEKGALLDVCRAARDGGWDQLSFVTVVDYLGKAAEGEAPALEAGMDVVYRLARTDKGGGLVLKVRIGRDKESVPSVREVWASADWHEREVFDLFGVRADGHPNLKRILLPEDWDDHPLRKDVDSLAKANKYQKLNK